MTPQAQDCFLTVNTLWEKVSAKHKLEEYKKLGVSLHMVSSALFVKMLHFS
jgi:hypothetical protein